MVGRLYLTLVALMGYAGGLRGDDADPFDPGRGQGAIAWNDFGPGTGMLGAISASASWEVLRDPIPVGFGTAIGLRQAFRLERDRP